MPLTILPESQKSQCGDALQRFAHKQDFTTGQAVRDETHQVLARRSEYFIPLLETSLLQDTGNRCGRAVLLLDSESTQEGFQEGITQLL